MKNALLKKMAGIAVLMLLLLIPLWMIGGTISERQHRHEEVLEDIAGSASGKQTVSGPVLVLPWVRTEPYTTTEDKKTITRHITTHGQQYFLPAALDVQGQLTTEERRRGLFKASVYRAALGIKGSFSLPANGGITEKPEQYSFGTPFVAVGIADIRGIHAGFRMTINGKSLDAKPGTGLKFMVDGLRADVPVWNIRRGDTLTYDMTLDLMGTQAFSIRPLGDETHMTLSSSWPHPSFTGQFLPVKRETGKQGFTAEWHSSVFSTNVREHFERCVDVGTCDAFDAKLMTVKLVDPVDHYAKTDRAMKYDLLFIGLAFAICFIYEVLRATRLHPLHYGLIGLGLALFYLLLLSLSEHIGFMPAYILSTLACCSLVGHYLSGVLGRREGWLFGSILTALFGALYGLLSSEDYALLMGTILIFSVLAGFMTLTRRIDWYQL